MGGGIRLGRRRCCCYSRGGDEADLFSVKSFPPLVKVQRTEFLLKKFAEFRCYSDEVGYIAIVTVLVLLVFSLVNSSSKSYGFFGSYLRAGCLLFGTGSWMEGLPLLLCENFVPRHITLASYVIARLLPQSSNQLLSINAASVAVAAMSFSRGLEGAENKYCDEEAGEEAGGRRGEGGGVVGHGDEGGPRWGKPDHAGKTGDGRPSDGGAGTTRRTTTGSASKDEERDWTGQAEDINEDDPPRPDEEELDAPHDDAKRASNLMAKSLSAAQGAMQKVGRTLAQVGAAVTRSMNFLVSSPNGELFLGELFLSAAGQEAVALDVTSLSRTTSDRLYADKHDVI